MAESELSTTFDNNGEQVILLTNVKQLDTNARSAEKNYAKTTVAILPEDEQAAEDITASIESIQAGGGSEYEDGWFYGSSVYLKSTVYYTTTPANEFYDVIAINKVNITCTVNSGTSISAMSLNMYQSGACLDGNFREQSKVFNALTTRSFSRPSTWQPVDESAGTSMVGAIISATATRSGGGSSSFSLPNNIV